MVRELILLRARPSWWNYFWYLLFFWLVLPLIVALVKRWSLLLIIYNDRIELTKGFLSKHVKEIFITDIRTIDIKQSFLQRILGFGDVRIATAGTAEYEDEMPGMPDPGKIRTIILQRRQLSLE